MVEDISPDMSFLEMLDVLNEKLTLDGQEPIAFDQRLPRGHLRHVRLVINGVAARPAAAATTTCQLHMRKLQDGDDDRGRAVARRRRFR